MNKPLSQSLTVRAIVALLTVALVKILSKYLPAELAQQFAAGVADEVVGAMLVGLAGLAVYGRARVGAPPAPPVPPTLPILLPALVLGACGGTWPATCSLAPGGGRSCHCATYRIVDRTPAGSPARRVTQECDGEPLPIVVLAAEVTRGAP